MISAAAASGRLTRKISRQPVSNRSASTSTPPITGPSTALSPITGPNSANALPTSSGPKAERMIPKPCGIMIAAQAPWSSRAAISAPEVGARPHSSEAIAKPATPSRNIRRRP